MVLVPPAWAKWSDVPADEFRAVVTALVDGDTVDIEARLLNLRIQERCRMVGYNAPEIRGDERPLGLRAVERLRQLLEGHDTVRVIATGRDKYHRLLCRVLLNDGTDLNASMRSWLEDDLRYDGAGKYDPLERASATH